MVFFECYPKIYTSRSLMVAPKRNKRNKAIFQVYKVFSTPKSSPVLISPHGPYQFQGSHFLCPASPLQSSKSPAKHYFYYSSRHHPLNTTSQQLYLTFLSCILGVIIHCFLDHWSALGLPRIQNHRLHTLV